MVCRSSIGFGWLPSRFLIGLPLLVGWKSWAKSWSDVYHAHLAFDGFYLLGSLFLWVQYFLESDLLSRTYSLFDRNYSWETKSSTWEANCRGQASLGLVKVGACWSTKTRKSRYLQECTWQALFRFLSWICKKILCLRVVSELLKARYLDRKRDERSRFWPLCWLHMELRPILRYSTIQTSIFVHSNWSSSLMKC